MWTTNLKEKNLVILPAPNAKYTVRDWENNNKSKARVSEDQQKLADRVIRLVCRILSKNLFLANQFCHFYSRSESERVIDETRSITDQWKKETDYRLKERVIDVSFQRDEIVKQKKDACLEEEALKTYKDRMINAIQNLNEQALVLCEKCIILREHRVSVDLVYDEVDQQLKKEHDVIQGARLLLHRVLDETKEQIRRLKAMMYLLDRDLSNKEASLHIDEQNLQLKESQMDLKIYEGNVPLDP